MKEHSTIKSIIFILCQHGAFKYFQPLFDLWRSEEKPFRWQVLLDTDIIKLSEDDRVKYNVLSSENKFFQSPNLIISSTSGSQLEKFYYNFAKIKKIKIIQLIDSSYNYKKRIFDTNGKNNYPNILLLIDRYSLKAAIRKDNIEIGICNCFGNPAWENIKMLKKKELHDILFISQPIKTDFDSRLGFNENDVIEELVELKKLKNVRSLNIVFHPREKKKKLRYFDNVFSDTEGIDRCGTIVGMFSSLMIDAYYSGRNIISFQPNLKQNMDFLSQRKLIKVVSTIDDLKSNLFSGCLIPPEKNPFKGSVKRLNNYLNMIIKKL